MKTNFKSVFLGCVGVGKSSIVQRMVWNRFNGDHQSTIGAAFSKVGNVEIWDTAGQERFKSIVPMYIRNAANAMIVFDATNEYTFKEATGYWWRLATEASPKPRIVLIRNKSDMLNNDEEPRRWDYAERWAFDHDAWFFETSAKNGSGIESLYNFLNEGTVPQQRMMQLDFADDDDDDTNKFFQYLPNRCCQN